MKIIMNIIHQNLKYIISILSNNYPVDAKKIISFTASQKLSPYYSLIIVLAKLFCNILELVLILFSILLSLLFIIFLFTYLSLIFIGYYVLLFITFQLLHKTFINCAVLKWEYDQHLT